MLGPNRLLLQVELDQQLELEVLAQYEEQLVEQLEEVEPEEIVEMDEDCEDVALFVQSRKGHTILQYGGHRYRKAYRSKHGIRWNCSTDKGCPAFLYLNDHDEIIMSNKIHKHSLPSMRISTRIKLTQQSSSRLAKARRCFSSGNTPTAVNTPNLTEPDGSAPRSRTAGLVSSLTMITSSLRLLKSTAMTRLNITLNRIMC
ncbi:uncharacterized protein LOC125242334 [Leguminivora glycinivorella]|uniref:uncharacterized protein LOC125242334 n=1 Tax=Leguminivora glycinivorella TaxID=1035111 RepID=UPI00200DB521|nr:uncharacterized protein LOC125242334 [Leguminivora glycinivorella]